MVKIACDSTADLLNEVYGTNLYAERNITVVPLFVRIGDEEYADGVDITMTKLLERCANLHTLPKTAAPEVARLERIYRELTSDGSELVFITISSEFSSSYNNACLAAKNVPGVYVVDSRNLSSGVGHIALEAADLAEEGKSAKEIKRVLDEEIVPRVETSFVLDGLEYMVKGGRCSSVAALGANLLQLHPSIGVIDGEMKVVKKYRGSWQRCLRSYIKDRLENRTDIRFKRIFITYTTTEEEIVDEVEQLIRQYSNFDEICRTTAGCTVASHCGPHTLGILFIRQ